MLHRRFGVAVVAVTVEAAVTVVVVVIVVEEVVVEVGPVGVGLSFSQVFLSLFHHTMAWHISNKALKLINIINRGYQLFWGEYEKYFIDSVDTYEFSRVRRMLTVVWGTRSMNLLSSSTEKNW